MSHTLAIHTKWSWINNKIYSNQNRFKYDIAFLFLEHWVLTGLNIFPFLITLLSWLLRIYSTRIFLSFLLPLFFRTMIYILRFFRFFLHFFTILICSRFMPSATSAKRTCQSTLVTIYKKHAMLRVLIKNSQWQCIIIDRNQRFVLQAAHAHFDNQHRFCF